MDWTRPTLGIRFSIPIAMELILTKQAMDSWNASGRIWTNTVMRLNLQTGTIRPIPQLVTPMAMDWAMAASISVSSMKTPHFGAIIRFKWSTFVMTRLVKQPM